MKFDIKYIICIISSYFVVIRAFEYNKYILVLLTNNGHPYRLTPNMGLSSWFCPHLSTPQNHAFPSHPQLPHSYYFTICILVLKFANKGVFFEEIQDLHFPRKRRYFGTHLHEFGVKGVTFDVLCFTVKKGVHLG